MKDSDDVNLSIRITPNGPIISDLEGKIYKHGNKCYKYSSNTDKCDSTKRQVDLKSKDTDNDT